MSVAPTGTGGLGRVYQQSACLYLFIFPNGTTGVDTMVFKSIARERFISVVVITLDFDSNQLPATPVRTRDGPPFCHPSYPTTIAGRAKASGQVQRAITSLALPDPDIRSKHS